MNPKFLPKPTFIKILILTLALLLSSQLTAAPAQAGDPDDLLVKSFGDGFGPDGSGSVALSGGEYHGLAIQADGKYVLAGTKQDDFLVARYNADGSPDTTFGPNGTGQVTTDFNNGSGDEAESVAIQPNGRIVVAGASGGDLAVARYLPNGDPDTSFNGVGRVTVDYDGGFDRAYDLALQPDGKIVAGGYGYDCGLILCEDQDFALARFNPDGTPDSSFSGDGLRRIGFGSHEEISSLAIQADGKIVAVGDKFASLSAPFRMARYNPDGSLDTTFDGDGKVSSSAFGNGEDVAVQPDGKLVVVSADGKLIRFNPNGALDSAFGSQGAVSLSTPAGPISLYRVALQPDNTILVAGGSQGLATPSDLVLARYTASGQLDTRFGGGTGYVIHSLLPSDKEWILDMAVDDSGRIAMLSGDLFLPASHLSRFFPDGSLDDRGRVFSNVQQGQPDEIRDVVVQPDGKVVAVGYYHHPGGSDHLTVARYQWYGVLDPGFGTNGFIKERVIPIPSQKVDTYGNAVALDAQGRIMVAGSKTKKSTGQTDFAVWGIDPDGPDDFFRTVDLGNYDEARAIAVQPDGKIVAAGSGSGNPLLARLTADGELDPGFGNNQSGLVTTDPPDGSGWFNDIALQPDGKIVATGYYIEDSPSIVTKYLVARYLPNGQPDTAFGGGDGLVLSNLGPGGHNATALALLADGKILVAGAVNGVATIVRYTAAGDLDSTFSGAVANFGVPGGAADLAVEADGGILLAGCPVDGSFALARFHADGRPDRRFSADGQAAFGLSNRRACARALAQDPISGHLIVAGYAEAGPDDAQFALARVKGAGAVVPPPPPPGGGGSGVVYLPIVMK